MVRDQLPRRPGPTKRVRVAEFVGDKPATRHEDRLVTEEPLELRLAAPGAPAQRVNVTMRTPGNDFELAAGWTIHERIPTAPGDVRQVAYCTDTTLDPEQEFNVVTVTLGAAPARWPGERLASTSACGVCGTQSIEEAVGADIGQVTAVQLSRDVIHALPDAMRDRQKIFEQTGSIHAAALFSPSGELVVLREDVGRHNAVDKVTGARVLAGAATAGLVLTTSGRIGFEIVQKAVVAGYAAVVAVGAPSSLAVDLAAQAGLMVVGFDRKQRFVCYTHPERVV